MPTSKKRILENIPSVKGDGSQNYGLPAAASSAIRWLTGDDRYDFTFFAAVTGDLFTQVARSAPGFGFTDCYSGELRYVKKIIKHTFDECGYECRVRNRERIKEDIVAAKFMTCGSIDRGIPVLTFGIVGPPVCSVISGYENGGDVLYGSSMFQSWEGFPDEGYFRKENGMENSDTLVFIGEKKPAPSLSEAYGRALDSIPVCAALPDVSAEGYNSLSFGARAFDSWAAGLLDDSNFTPDKITDAQDAHMGLFCITATNVHHIGRLLPRFYEYCPEKKGFIDRYAALFEKQKALCDEIYAVHGGFWLPPEKLAERETRVKLSDILTREAELHREIAGLK